MSRQTTSSTATQDRSSGSLADCRPPLQQAVEEVPRDFCGFVQQLNEALNINFSLTPQEIKELKQEWSKTSVAIRKPMQTVRCNRSGKGTFGWQKKPTT